MQVLAMVSTVARQSICNRLLVSLGEIASQRPTNPRCCRLPFSTSFSLLWQTYGSYLKFDRSRLWIIENIDYSTRRDSRSSACAQTSSYRRHLSRIRNSGTAQDLRVRGSWRINRYQKNIRCRANTTHPRTYAESKRNGRRLSDSRNRRTQKLFSRHLNQVDFKRKKVRGPVNPSIHTPGLTIYPRIPTN